MLSQLLLFQRFTLVFVISFYIVNGKNINDPLDRNTQNIRPFHKTSMIEPNVSGWIMIEPIEEPVYEGEPIKLPMEVPEEEVEIPYTEDYIEFESDETAEDEFVTEPPDEESTYESEPVEEPIYEGNLPSEEPPEQTEEPEESKESLEFPEPETTEEPEEGLETTEIANSSEEEEVTDETTNESEESEPTEDFVEPETTEMVDITKEQEVTEVTEKITNESVGSEQTEESDTTTTEAIPSQMVNITTPDSPTSEISSTSAIPITQSVASSETPAMCPCSITTPLPPSRTKIYKDCELAGKLSYSYPDIFEWNEQLESWLCLSSVTTNFTGSYHLELPNSTLLYYGIFKISNRWCSDTFNLSNPCNVVCDELLHESLEESVSCSQYIYKLVGFNEWPEYERSCENKTMEYLRKCEAPPSFQLSEDSETTKVFGIFDGDQNISCTATGFPPVMLGWDEDTMNYIRNSSGRLIVSPEEKESDGNWTMRHIITFMEVWESDKRTYFCNANNTVGSASQPYIVDVVTSDASESVWNSPLLIIGGSVIGSSSFILIILVVIIKRRRRREEINAALAELYEQFKYGNQDKKSHNNFNNKNKNDYVSYFPFVNYETHQKAQDLPFPKVLNLLAHRLEVNRSIVLGRGAFGIVFEGMLDKKKVVAVKTVAKGADQSQLAALLSEVKIMNYVGRHPNIVQLLGVQMVDLRKGTVLVAIEYCSKGSLKCVLEEKRRELAKRNNHVDFTYHVPATTGSLPPPDVVSAQPFSTHQLLMFSHQVCSAMQYLETKNIIHGDLAARNVLLDSNLQAKISDFGLSRQIYENKKYCLVTKETALPWRWLAIETLRDLKFSIESDVWAFGVFLWEVFSLAELPYTAGVNLGLDFANYLEGGFRLQIPEYASEELYELMRRCWEVEPSKRIRFQELSDELSAHLESEYNKGSYRLRFKPIIDFSGL